MLTSFYNATTISGTKNALIIYKKHDTFHIKDNWIVFLFSGKALTQLDLSQNMLNQVPSPAFKNLHHLLILNLNHNKIGALHSKAFEGLDTLEILTLYANKISIIEPDTFKGLEKYV